MFRFLRLLNGCFFATLFLAAACCRAESDAVVYLSPTAIAESKAMRAIAESREGKLFYAMLVDKLDANYLEATQSPDFPAAFDAWFQNSVKKALGKETLSSADLIEGFFTHVHHLLFEIDLTPQGKFDLLNKIDLQGVFSAELGFDPRLLAGVLEFGKEGKDYRFVRNDSEMVILSDNEEKIFAGGVRRKTDASRFVIAVGLKREVVEQKLTAARQGDVLVPAGMEKTLVGMRCSRALKEKVVEDILLKNKEANQDQEQTGTRQHLAILEKFESLEFTVADQETTTVMRWRVAASDAKNAKLLRQMIDGGLAMLLFLADSKELTGNEKRAVEVLHAITTGCEGSSVSVTLPIDEAMIELIRFGLDEGYIKMWATIRNKSD